MKMRKANHALSMLIIAGVFFISCNDGAKKQTETIDPADTTATVAANTDSIEYQTDQLTIRKLSAHVYQHISFLNTNDFGRVACNGMVVVNGNQAIIFDTPTDDIGAEELINHVTQKLKANIIAIIPTHFHADCLGGIEKFHEHQIPAYASGRTIALLKNEKTNTDLIQSFNDSISWNVGDMKVYAEFFGEGHTKDNIIGYVPADDAIFGGCLIKELGATKGYLGDANVATWPATVQKLKEAHPQTKVIIPGHGEPGGLALLDYTIQLFE